MEVSHGELEVSRELGDIGESWVVRGITITSLANDRILGNYRITYK